MTAIVVGGQDVWGGGIAVGAWHTGVLGSDIATGGFDGGSPLAGMPGLQPTSRYTAWVVSAPAGVSGVWDTTNAALALTADTAGVYTIVIGVAEDGASIGTAEILWFAGVAGGNGASITLADASLSAAGLVAVTGGLSVTLDAATLAAAGGAAIDGAAAITLSDAAVAAAGDVAVTGAAAATLDAAALVATGTIDSTETFGAAAITLASDAVAGAGVVAIAGAAVVTLASDVLAATGTADSNEIAGAGAIMLASDVLAAAGVVPITGGASIALANATLVAADQALATVILRPRLRRLTGGKKQSLLLH